eukprot:1896114-Rhodomonas_salina.2
MSVCAYGTTAQRVLRGTDGGHAATAQRALRGTNCAYAAMHSVYERVLRFVDAVHSLSLIHI